MSFDMVGQVIFFPGSEFFINYLSLIADDEDSFPPKKYYHILSAHVASARIQYTHRRPSAESR